MNDKKLDDILIKLQKLEEMFQSLVKSNDQTVLALIPYKAALEQMIRKGLIDPEELDKNANELLEQFKNSQEKKEFNHE